jgi:hypothetical protein
LPCECGLDFVRKLDRVVRGPHQFRRCGGAGRRFEQRRQPFEIGALCLLFCLLGSFNCLFRCGCRLDERRAFLLRKLLRPISAWRWASIASRSSRQRLRVNVPTPPPPGPLGPLGAASGGLGSVNATGSIVNAIC